MDHFKFDGVLRILSGNLTAVDTVQMTYKVEKDEV